MDDVVILHLLVQIIRPFLHHLPALIKETGAVIGGIDLVRGRMGKLSVHDLMSIAELFLDRGHRQRAETVAGHASLVTDAAKRKKNGVVAHVLTRMGLTWKNPFPFASMLTLFFQDSQRLP